MSRDSVGSVRRKFGPAGRPAGLGGPQAQRTAAAAPPFSGTDPAASGAAAAGQGESRIRRPDGPTALKRRLLRGLPTGLAAASGGGGGGAGRVGVLAVALHEWDTVAGDAAAEAKWLRRRVEAALRQSGQL